MEEVKTESTVVDNSEAATVATEKVVTTPAEVTPTVSLKSLLAEDLRDHKALQNYEDVNAMAKSLLSAQEMVGKRIQDLSADELKALDAKFDRPESAEGYAFDAAEAFKEKAFEAGLSVKQASELYNIEKTGLDKISAEKATIKAEAADKAAMELEDIFGSQLEARIDLARKAAVELGGDALADSIFNSDEGINPQLVKALSEAGKRIFDHTSVGTEQVTKFGLTPQEAVNEISLMKASPEFRAAYENRDPSIRQAAIAKLSKLNDIAFPEG